VCFSAKNAGYIPIFAQTSVNECFSVAKNLSNTFWLYRELII